MKVGILQEKSNQDAGTLYVSLDFDKMRIEKVNQPAMLLGKGKVYQVKR
jgi:hypothetical protein